MESKSFLSYLDSLLYRYSDELVQQRSRICAFNLIKPEYVVCATNEVKFRNCKNCFIQASKIPVDFLEFDKLFQREDGQWTELPKYVVDQISDAIRSINLRPNYMTMTSKDTHHYVLHVTYTTKGIKQLSPNTTISLTYTFPKGLIQFQGYFSKEVVWKKQLPHYEIVPDPSDVKATVLRVVYDSKKPKKGETRPSDPRNLISTLEVKIDSNDQKDFLQNIFSDTIHISEIPSEKIPALTLAEAVLRRVFPSKAHLWKLTISDLIDTAKKDFHDNLSLTPLDWCRRPSLERTRLANFVCKCLLKNKLKAISTPTVSFDGVRKAMDSLIKKYPFFVANPHSLGPDGCLLDLWRSYFNKELTQEAAQRMELSMAAKNNLLKYYTNDPEKYSNFFELFPAIRESLSDADMEWRLQKMNIDQHTFTPKDVIEFNRIKSNVPARWRNYIGRIVSASKPMKIESVMGDVILEKKSTNIAPIDVIEAINYHDVEYEIPPPLDQLLQKVDLFTVYKYDPALLEQRFMRYTFSKDYQTRPTDDDCLAIRYANVYKGGKYKVPEVPQDFYTRLLECATQTEDEDVCTVANQCVSCLCTKKSHSFPCGHLCVCEHCSLFMLKCPLCNRVGEAHKVYM